MIRFDSLANQPTSGCDIDNYPLKVPNVITPNGDTRNDAFILDRLALYPEAQLRILNRYGMLVFEGAPYANNWEAQGLPAGAYYYVLVTGRGAVLRGWVEVLK